MEGNLSKDSVSFDRVVDEDDEGGRKRAERKEVKKPHNPDRVKYIEKQLWDKGVQRMERHPVDGLGGLGQPPPKSGHGGKYTWEDPCDAAENELSPTLPAIDEGDPNYVEEEEEKGVVKDEEPQVVGEVEVAKLAQDREGVAKLEINPPLGV
ncbi:PREDICTED: uncharacterized protein LOC104591302 [Nelumbo nucifera]|uniref:Uncharacterized protein n=2 Tax=Nelumbo nucifera TaxID=4432 RepID=A0A822ZW08_NELNU|nr:PREDICTED: uncharacterized protein LOC104591302 [Nelumbo nucifera]DAD48680.1 TPA_asm: hypothetical protein HUJ06_018617 [Nelumbo nucifera]